MTNLKGRDRVEDEEMGRLGTCFQLNSRILFLSQYFKYPTSANPKTVVASTIQLSGVKTQKKKKIISRNVLTCNIYVRLAGFFFNG